MCAAALHHRVVTKHFLDRFAQRLGTVNRLGLTATLMKCLTTTNIIENPNGTVRRQTRRVSRWQNGAMVLRWAASALLNAEKKFRRVSGHSELWMLENALKTLLIEKQPVAELASEEKAA